MPSHKPKQSSTRATARNQVARPVNGPSTQGQQQPGQITQLSYQEQTSGFLLPPMMLERYEQILPGFSERWFALLEKQDAHRIAMERHTIIGDGWRSWAGIACAFLICIATIAAAVILGLSRHDPGGTILSGVLGTGGVAGVAGVFIYGTSSRRQEREYKARLMTGQQ